MAYNVKSASYQPLHSHCPGISCCGLPSPRLGPQSGRFALRGERRPHWELWAALHWILHHNVNYLLSSPSLSSPLVRVTMRERDYSIHGMLVVYVGLLWSSYNKFISELVSIFNSSSFISGSVSSSVLVGTLQDNQPFYIFYFCVAQQH